MKLILLTSLFLIVAFSTYAQTSKEDFSDDWAALSHYAKENDSLSKTPPVKGRVIFLGSSIIEFWKDSMPGLFSKSYLDRGISGQISSQLLIRFKQDVIDLKPAAVIILAGSNDLAGNKGHVSNQTIMNNITSMAELAKLHGINVILCQNLPVYDYPWRKGLQPANQIIALNKLIKAYADTHQLGLIDFFNPLKDERNGQKAELTKDGVHPNLAGYKIMAVVAEKEIRKVLSTSNK